LIVPFFASFFDATFIVCPISREAVVSCCHLADVHSVMVDPPGRESASGAMLPKFSAWTDADQIALNDIASCREIQSQIDIDGNRCARLARDGLDEHIGLTGCECDGWSPTMDLAGKRRG
jgi:hypothetical protein